MKKVLAIMLSCALLVGLFSLTAIAADDGTENLYTTQQVDMYSQPNSMSSVLQVIPAGSTVISYKIKQNGFTDCYYGKTPGWIATSFLTAIKPSTSNNQNKTVTKQSYTTKPANSTTWYGGYDWSTVYNYDYYKDNNLDVVKAFGTDPDALISHFVNFGINEGRKGSADFDVNDYILKHKDLFNKYRWDFQIYYKDACGIPY